MGILSGSVADPRHFDVDKDPDPRMLPLLIDPDPSIFIIDLQGANKKLI
jgi:hypothetical protein